MSATNRGAERENEDTYITPTWAVDRLLEAYALPQGAVVLDPCCANGELLAHLHKRRPDLILIGFELRDECRPYLAALVASGVLRGFAIGSYSELAKSVGDHEVDFVVSNPPYCLAQEFIETSERIAKISIWLLRQNFLGAQDRIAFTARTHPGFLSLPNRPSFDGFGGDATEYCWMIYFDPEWRGRWAPLSSTSKDVIKAWNASARLRYPQRNPKLRRLKSVEESA